MYPPYFPIIIPPPFIYIPSSDDEDCEPWTDKDTGCFFFKLAFWFLLFILCFIYKVGV